MNKELLLYFKELGDNYSIAFEDLSQSSIALTLIKGIAMDFELDVLKYISDQVAKGNTEEEKNKIKIQSNEKVKDKLDRIEIMRNCIKVFERVVGREESLRSVIDVKDKQSYRLLQKVRELEQKIENMEIYIGNEVIE